jgi:ATP-dependent protease ClpP protease subunit
MQYKYVQNITSNGEATIRLYRPIGNSYDGGVLVEGINGADFANEIERLQNTAKQINVRINSVGGNVLEGYSIVSAIQNSKIPVHCYIDGLAASIAGVIALCGNVVHIADYGTIMLHNPSGTANKEVLSLIKNTLVTIMAGNSKLTPEIISSLMDNETYINAIDAFEVYGLVDEVITTNKKLDIKTSTASLTELAMVYNKLIPKEEEMKTVKNKLGLDDSVSEEIVVKKIEILQAENEKLIQDLANEVLLKENLESELESFKAEKEAEKTLAIESLVNTAITANKIKNEEKESFTKLATIDFELAKNILDKINTKVVANISNAAKIGQSTSTVLSGERANWTLRDWEIKDPAGAERIHNETPEIYKAMFDAEYGKKK